jgi:hypothetical protein
MKMSVSSRWSLPWGTKPAKATTSLAERLDQYVSSSSVDYSTYQDSLRTPMSKWVRWPGQDESLATRIQ